MHPSNYTARRRNSHREDKNNEESAKAAQENSTSSLQLKSDHNCISRSDSPVLAEDLGISDKLCIKDSANTDYYNITCTDSFSADGISNNCCDTSVKINNEGTFGVVNQHGDLLHNNQQNINQIDRERRRSGSWSGVNESDDDMEQLSRDCVPVIHVENSNNYGSISSTSSCPDLIPEVTVPHSCQAYSGSCDSYSVESAGGDAQNIATVEEKIKRNLKFFFMNPVEKWRAKRRFPWKLLVQIIKIIIVTAQLCTFATQRYNRVHYLLDTKIAFSHLFIKGWDSSREVTAYPPSNGPLALYEISAFYGFLDYAVTTFSKVEGVAIGAYKYDYANDSVSMPVFCISQYAHGTRGADNLPYITDSEIKRQCIHIPSYVINSTEEWSTKSFLEKNNITINFDFFLDASFFLVLKAIKLQSTFPMEIPECYRLETTLYFDNNDHDGQMLVDLDIGAMVLDCNGESNVIHEETKELHVVRNILNILTISICSLSFVMCLRAVYRAISLKNVTDKFFKMRFSRGLTQWEKFEFINLWYVLICLNDVMIIVGSIIKIGLESEDYEGYLDKWNVCSLLLGMGNLLIWFGCLRYLGFFETYNVLILTVRSCIPNVLRFSICILMVFAGYAFCGWLVLGPYHLKFRSLSSTIECLYSLVNGDDMFATFSLVNGKEWVVWWFSRIYLYTFISLFIYVILSLFIAIIMDAYETIKNYYENGFPVTELVKFASECRDDPDSGAYSDEERTMQDIINYICCCSHSHRRRPPSPGYDPLPS